MAADAEDRRTLDSGIEIKPTYRPGDLEGWSYDERLGEPGKFPYTRGVYPNMYRGRPWTMRQYSGFGTAEATNERWKMLLASGSTGLCCAFDLPTQMGYDSDHPRAEGEIGKVGVAIDSLADMRLLLGGPAPRHDLDVDDDQRHVVHPPAALPAGRRGERRRPARC